MDEEKTLWQKLTDWKRSPVYRYLRVRPLVKVLNEGFYIGQSDAAEKLGRIGDKSALPCLIDALKKKENTDFVRASAATALGMINDNSAVPALLESMADSSTFVWGHIVFVLKDMVKNCKSIGQLEEMQKKLEEGIKNILKRYPGGMKTVPPFIRLTAAKVMVLAANKKNDLASDKGILLDDTPKPPKRDKLYRQLRKIYR